MESQIKELIPIVLEVFALLGGVAAVVYGVLRFLNKDREFFDSLVENLTSDKKSTQLAAAIRLRRYLGKKGLKLIKKREAIDVISSMTRTIPTGTFQKILVDGLPYAVDLSGCDLQRTNLQDAYIGRKKGEGIITMYRTDMFLSDLSYALLENIIGFETIFYRATLFNTHIKNCNFSYANFCEADLTRVCFKNTILYKSDFSGALNVPEEIARNLENGKYQKEEPVTIIPQTNGKKIFFSMPGIMSKNEEVLIKNFKKMLEGKGYEIIYYNRDNYPNYGQLTRVRASIMESVAMVAFGFKQTYVDKATHRPGTQYSETWECQWFSTPWIEIEVGMGLMKGLPILLLFDSEIREGVFDNKLNECFVGRIELNEDFREIDHSNVEIEKWLSKI